MSNDDNKNNFNLRSFAIGGAAVGMLALMYNLASAPADSQRNPSEEFYTNFVERAKRSEFGAVFVEGSRMTGIMPGGSKFTTSIPPGDANVVKELRDSGVKIVSRPPSEPSIILSWIPTLLLIGVFVWMIRKQMGMGRGGVGGGGAMGFGKSRAKLLNENKKKVTFDDVAGIEEAKQDLEEIVEFLKDPRKFQRLGGRIPRGGLLVGPPGTGKTLVARAVAGEANVPFFSISGSDFVEMFVGVGASRVRDMFAEAKKNAPCIIFIDEIDAVGRARSANGGGGNDEREQTLNQLLVEMDGFEKDDAGIIILAATNRPDILDAALKRPGRFDRQIVVGLPDIMAREKILKVHMRNKPVAPDVDVRVIARGTPGMSGADLENVTNEAALMSARRNKRFITMQEFDDAKDKVLMGPERKSHVMDEAEKKLVAYHEAGHALLAIDQKHSHPIHKATIIPRGNAGGFVLRLPEKDGGSMYLRQLEADLVVAAGGRVAEEIAFGKENISIGAQGDIRMATKVARAMVTEYGASDKIGFVNHSPSSLEMFPGQSLGGGSGASQATLEAIDAEIKAITDRAYQQATTILNAKKDQLENIAQALLEYETLTGEEVKTAAAHGKDAVGELRHNKQRMAANSNSPGGSVPMAGPAREIG